MRHRIRSQRMEVNFNEKDKAEALHQSLADLCRTAIGEVIDACLKTYSIKDAVISIKVIDLDLGTIAYNEMKTELPRRLYDQLDRELARIVLNSNDQSIEVKASKTIALESIEFYLQHGYLPWNSSFQNVQKLVNECLKNSAIDFSKIIRKKGQSSLIRYRIVHRFSNDLIKRTIHGLQPRHAPMIVEFHNQLVVINTQTLLVRSSTSAIEKTLWHFVLNNLLVEQGSVFNAINFAKSVLHQFSCHYNIDYDELIDLLKTGIQQWKKDVPAPFFNLINEIVTEDREGKRNEMDTTTQLNTLFRSLLDSQQSFNEERSSAKELTKEESLAVILLNHKNEFVQFLKYQTNKIEVVGKIIEGVGEQLRTKLVHVLEPHDHRKILSYKWHILTVHKNKPLVKASYQHLDDRLWTFLIVSLLENYGSKFNHRSFIRGFLTQTAAHYDLTVDQVQKRLHTFIMNMPTAPPGIRQFLQILDELFPIANKSQTHAGKLKGLSKIDKATKGAGEIALLELLKKSSFPLKRSEENLLLTQLQGISLQSKRMLRKEMFSPRHRAKMSTLSESGFEKMLQSLLSASESTLLIKWLQLFRENNIPLGNTFGSKRAFVNGLHLSLLHSLFATRSQTSITEPDAITEWINVFLAHNTLISKEAFMNSLKETQKDKAVKKVLQIITKTSDTRILTQTPTYVSEQARLIVQWLLHTRNRYPVPATIGFTTYSEALNFVTFHCAEEISNHLRTTKPTTTWSFFQKLTMQELNEIARMSTAYAKSWNSALLQEWAHRLNGYYKQQEVLTELHRVILWSFYLELNTSDKLFLNSVCSVLNRYALPKKFYEQGRSWMLPAHGDITLAIQEIEMELMHEPMVKLQKTRSAVKNKVKPEDIQRDASRQEARSKQIQKKAEADAIYIVNAGLVLLHPYFNYLFDQMRLLDKGQFSNVDSVMKAIALLHYAASGSEVLAEEDCVLNKVLCGYSIDEPVLQIQLTPEDKEMVDSMLAAFKSHWSVISTSSHDEVRGNWLVREGRLVETEKNWELYVERKPYDLLMANLPFTLSPVCFSWMKKLMIIHWL